MKQLLSSLFDYKAWANAQLLARLAAAPADKQVRAEFQNALRVMNHTHVVDNIFLGHWQGQPHGHNATNTLDTPSLPKLTQAIAGADARWQALVGALTDDQLNDTIRFTFTDGDLGCMTRAEILMHVITHGSNHRGSVTQIMKDLGITPPRDLYTKYLHDTQPQRRAT